MKKILSKIVSKYKSLNKTQKLIFWTLIIWGVYDVLTFIIGETTISEETTSFHLKSASPPLLIATLYAHFFMNKKLKYYSKPKYEGNDVGYAAVPWWGKVIIGSVFVFE